MGSNNRVGFFSSCKENRAQLLGFHPATAELHHHRYSRQLRVPRTAHPCSALYTSGLMNVWYWWGRVWRQSGQQSKMLIFAKASMRILFCIFFFSCKVGMFLTVDSLHSLFPKHLYHEIRVLLWLRVAVLRSKIQKLHKGKKNKINVKW